MILGLERVASPIGPVLLVSDGRSLLALEFDEPEERLLPLLRRRFGSSLLLREAVTGFAPALRAYFNGALEALDGWPLDPGGTPFQQRCWAALRAIPAGQTRSYGRVAADLGLPRAARAVGLANALNPVSIAIPCHRLVGHDGALTGYGGGLERKRWLLRHEAASMGSTVDGASVS
ncbi:methylated-DNA--[protein]-cysteine S-methyltransferase [Teichococcus oryzae]|uniref:Methylated-DNA--protein-cysteine methyltransferase n=1 Tax=Teichococcus oryzae TaxID=1608942 RepID=A0A5B2THS9_9PROT|nr:methylated-DNA--[protein]-cysteine S-methyltransferase [Pseudoroseomonas oryzae]KAA2213653.1 methylated-DNA--[protein]-cysteine S-methyltransferase [Pseudoroseomonas oryzae]